MTMQPMTVERLEELRSLAEAATPGPWATDDNTITYEQGPVATANHLHDAAFIAVARQAIPELIREVWRLRGTLEDIRDSTRSNEWSLRRTATDAVGQRKPWLGESFRL